MTEKDQLKNILAFLCIIFGEDILLSTELMNKSPEYIIEKFERYVLSDKPQSEWGIHPSLRAYLFDKYLTKWSISE